MTAPALDFVALDVETANPFRGSICQVGMARVRAGRVVGTWGTLLRPPAGRDWFDPDNVAVHGIRAQDILAAPSLDEAWSQIVTRLAGRPVVAHNAAFDMGALHAAASVTGLDHPSLDVACSLVLARKRYDVPRHTLDACCSAAGIPLDHHHEAVADARAAADLVIDMAAQVEAQDLDELLTASGVRWGHLDLEGYTPCRSVAPDAGTAVPRLF